MAIVSDRFYMDLMDDNNFELDTVVETVETDYFDFERRNFPPDDNFIQDIILQAKQEDSFVPSAAEESPQNVDYHFVAQPAAVLSTPRRRNLKRPAKIKNCNDFLFDNAEPQNEFSFLLSDGVLLGDPTEDLPLHMDLESEHDWNLVPAKSPKKSTTKRKLLLSFQ